MNSEVRTLFHELADLAPAERDQAFRERGTAPEVRAEVESLLRFDSAGDGTLTGSVSSVAGQLLESNVGHPFGQCGPYRLVRLLGSGGMGTVYLGERVDGEIRQKVAVKLLRVDEHRQAWRDRFLKERQLLASLQHPSIVHVLDAGKTADGRPYLAMEYVEGTPIDTYCEGIDVWDRLRLFLRVCEGVSHAHQHLIVHRDLKPSNILVDGTGQPKLLDFGIAKMLDETGDATVTAERLLTPKYASPEQMRGSVQTTATDVYSLGAVLYRMLTGRSPHESDTGALSVMSGETQIAPASRWNPALRGDMDYILRKALRQEPEERYRTVEAFARDVEALLESKPVEARSGNAWYRTRKFVRRYRVPVIAMLVVIASLAIGLFVANRQRMIAERRFRQLRQLSKNVLDFDSAIRFLPGSTKARERLISVSLQYLEGLASDAAKDADVALDVGNGYLSVARVQGVPNSLNLGQTAKAEESLKKAEGFMERVLAARPGDRDGLFGSAGVAHDRMILAQQEHRDPDAIAYAHRAAERWEAFLRRGDSTDRERAEAASEFADLALAHLNMHLYPDAIRYVGRSLELGRPLRFAWRQVAQALSLQANALRYQGNLEDALRSIEEARRMAAESEYPSETERALALFGIRFREGLILGEEGGINLGRPEEAVDALQAAFDLMEDGARKDPQDGAFRIRIASAGIPLGNILVSRDAKRALAVFDLTIQRLKEIQNNRAARMDLARALASSSYALRRLRRGAEAKGRIENALGILKETGNYPAVTVALGSDVYTVLRAQADWESELGNLRRAVQMSEQLVEKVMAAHPGHLTDLRNAPPMSDLYEASGALYRRAGEADKAAKSEALRRAIWEQWNHKLPGNTFVLGQMKR